MLDPNMTLLFTALEGVVKDLKVDAEDDAAWAVARGAVAHYGVKEADDEDLHMAVELCDAETLLEIHSGWESGQRLMLVRDRDVLKRALKAYRKRLKVTLLDAESSVSGGPMSGGRSSDIVGIAPPERYPREVWDMLVQQKRLINQGQGTYELPAGT
ncbi:MAG: hypothetical protein ACI8QS_001993 [Planctomycetota bacterium]|jgi:hypothetical protein